MSEIEDKAGITHTELDEFLERYKELNIKESLSLDLKISFMKMWKIGFDLGFEIGSLRKI